jgi:hypothetical protein
MGHRSMLSDCIVNSPSGLEHLCRAKRWLVDQPVWNAGPPVLRGPPCTQSGQAWFANGHPVFDPLDSS